MKCSNIVAAGASLTVRTIDAVLLPKAVVRQSTLVIIWANGDRVSTRWRSEGR